MAVSPNALFHWVSETDDGLRIVDVWESREAFGQFAEEQIGPYTREVGIDGGTRDRVPRGPQLHHRALNTQASARAKAAQASSPKTANTTRPSVFGS